MRKRERLKGILAKPAIFILTAALLLQGPGVAFAEETKSGTEFWRKLRPERLMRPMAAMMWRLRM